MKVTFLSNYINHHQIPFSNEMYRRLGEDYVFIQTQPMEEERRNMGWESKEDTLPYVHCLYEEEEYCKNLIMESDCVLAGWSDREELVQQRLNAGKLTFRISERIYREGQWKAISPRGLVHKYQEHIRYRKKPVYLLCAGAYVASDFHLIHAYPHKMYRFGYFPEMRTYEGTQLWEKKSSEQIDIIFAGRFLPLKHPEYMIRLAADLKKDFPKQPFKIHMAGSGELEEQLHHLAKTLRVEDLVVFYGFQPPEKVRDLMEQCHIHIFPSNRLEGWGAVVNEAMNSGCVVVANSEAGAVPYLIDSGRNGLIYHGSYEYLLEQTEELLRNPERIGKMAQKAYDTIQSSWNAEHAVNELLRCIEEVREKGSFEPAKEGPLSVAPILRLKK